MDRHVISAEQLFGCDGDADPIEDMITMCLDDRLNARCGEANQKSPDLRLRARVEMRLRVLNDEYRTGSATQCGDNDREAIGQSEPNACWANPICRHIETTELECSGTGLREPSRSDSGWTHDRGEPCLGLRSQCWRQ